MSSKNNKKIHQKVLTMYDICYIIYMLKQSKNCLGNNLEVTLPFNSMYIKDSKYPLTVQNSVWNNGDKIGNFTFDSRAEVEWLSLLLNDGFKIKKIPLDEALKNME